MWIEINKVKEEEVHPKKLWDISEKPAYDM